jgi:hypothetical protein
MNHLPALIGLRYRLIWAQARSRSGKLALFGVGALFAVLAAVVLGLGGYGVAAVAIRMHRVEFITRSVFGAVFVLAIVAAATLGLGVSAAFSDATLRRYPLTRRGRFLVRHLAGLLDPLWILVLVLDLGVAAGLAALGVTTWTLAVPVAVLLALSNYTAACVLVDLMDRLARSPTGRLALFALGLALLGVSPVAPRHGPGGRGAPGTAFPVLWFTPPAAAAAAVAGTTPGRSLVGGLYLAGWFACLLAVLLVLERRPIRSRTVPEAVATWNDASDRVAALFGPSLGPLLAKMIRYYTRSQHVRWNYPVTLPGLATVTLMAARASGRTEDPMAVFFALLGGIAALGFCANGALSLNVFGFDGAGFRRYFMLPAPPRLALLAAGLVALAPAASLVPVVILAWLALAPIPTDARMLAMLLSSALAGLFLYQSLGLWASVLAPRPIPFAGRWGNRLSLPAGLVLMTGVCAFLGLPYAGVAFGAGLMRAWWLLPLAALAGAAVFALTVRAGGAVLNARREQMLAVIESKA